MNYKFSDLIEVAKVQRLNDLFYTATGISGAVIDLQGTIITCSGWQDVCTKFHRVNAETVQQCVESDTVVANQVGVGQTYTVYTCGNGLVVAASPIAIGDEHVANFITSQFLFQPPDINSFLKQAKRFGFDETAYLEAVGKIPVIDEVRLQPFLEYFSEFAAMLGEMGLKQLRQLEAAAALKDSEQRWATTLSSIGDAVIATDTHGRITFMNGVAEKLTGWALAEAAAKPVTDVFNIINERTRRAVDNPVRRVLQKGMIAGLANHTLLLSRDGREIPIDDSAAPIKDRTGNTKGVVLVFRDITERRRAEKELLRAKEEWGFTFDSMPDMIAIIDAEHRTLRVNEAMARRLGRKAEECVGLHCYETVHGLSAPPSFCPHSRSLRDGSQHTEEITEDRLGGGCFLVSTTPLQVPGGQIMRTVHVARDITERKAAEEALRESQTRMNRAQEIAHLGSWELDLMNNRLSWSDEVYRIFGLQPQEFSATYNAFLEAVHPEDREAVDAAYSGSLREGRDTYEIEHRVVRRSSGEIRIVHEKCEHFRDDTGRIVKSVGMVHDITERKRVEQELREARLELERKVAERTAELRRSETYLSEAQRLTHTGSWAFDLASGKFVYASEECIRMYEHDAQEGLPTREATFRLIQPEDRDSVQGGFEKSLREKVDTSSEFRLVLPSGTVKHVQTIRHPVLNEVGDVVELVGTTIDITERKQAREALQNLMADLESRVEERTKELSEANALLETANKELESFSYSVSHDLRAPLRAIDGFSMMVLKDYADKLDDEGRRKLNVIRSNTQQMGKLIDNLLAFSRLGRKELVTTRLDMEALVQSVWRELSLLHPERRIQYTVNTLPPAQGDPALVKEVVVNLLSNAIKFTKYRETTIVEVGAYPEEGRNVYFVKDNGVGFDMKYYDKLFGVFQRLHTADEFEGTGVGLAIVHRIISRHGGRVWAESEVGKGAVFYFSLPEGAK